MSDTWVIQTPFNPAIEGEDPSGVLLAALERVRHDMVALPPLSPPSLTGVRDPQSGVLDLAAWRQILEGVALAVGKVLDRGAWPLVLGGDCSLLPGVVHAFAGRDPGAGLLVLDAHADFHTLESSETGDPADFATRMVSGRGPLDTTEIAFAGTLDDRSMLVAGLRSFEGIETTPIMTLPAPETTSEAILNALEQLALDRFWIHLDVDVVDPSELPVMYPEPGGLTFEELERLVTELAGTARHVLGLDVCCYHPALDEGGRGARELARVISVVAPGPGL